MSNLIDLPRLQQAWARVQEADGMPGVDGVSLAWYAEHLDEELAQLSRELTNRSYQPLPLLRFFVRKSKGGQRPLCVLTVRDRVAQHAVISVIGPILEAEFEACSFAYRKGRSVQQALAQVEQLREAGYEYVVDADITACFENVQHDLLLHRLQELVQDNDILHLIRLWLTARVYDGEKFLTVEKGLPQGAPISPLLANLYLDSFDERILDAGQKLVRFADDFLILCKTRPEAESALQLTREALDELRLTVNADKTQITDFASGFKFLGATFVRSLTLVPAPGQRKRIDPQSPLTMPPPLPLLRIRPGAKQPFNQVLRDELLEAEAIIAGRPTDETMPPPAVASLRTLYLHEHGSVLRCEDEHLRIVKENVELLSLPAFKIDQIVLFGNTQVTTPAMKFCLTHNIPIILLSGRGEFFGTIESTGNDNVLLQQTQFQRVADQAFTLETARQIVAGKIANSRALLQRRQRAAADERLKRAIAGLEATRRHLTEAATLDEVRGYEGAAAAHYFAGFAACFQEPFSFKGRNRRPPLDPVNALLSFGYTLLFYNLYALMRGRGLSPYVGSLHSLRQGHPALCSDLIEEFRAPVIDSLVTTVLNKRMFAPTDFYLAETGSGKQGCFLTDAARRRFVAQFEQRVNTIIQHPRSGLRVTWRGCMDIQIGHYIQVLRGEAEKYLPVEIR